jgi:hypothetical protein
VAAAALTVGLAEVLAGCGSNGPAAGIYGPAGHRFTVAFPSAPKAESDTGNLREGLPATSKTYGYQVSGESDIFAHSATVPRPPAYGVAIAALPSTSFARTLAGGLQKSLKAKAKAVTVNGAAGAEIVGAEKTFPSQGTVPDPNASEGLLVVRQGSTVFLVLAVTSKATTTRAFLRSFRPSS